MGIPPITDAERAELLELARRAKVSPCAVCSDRWDGGTCINCDNAKAVAISRYRVAANNAAPGFEEALAQAQEHAKRADKQACDLQTNLFEVKKVVDLVMDMLHGNAAREGIMSELLQIEFKFK